MTMLRKTSLAALALAGMAVPIVRSADKPNVLLIMCDDRGPSFSPPQCISGTKGSQKPGLIPRVPV